MMSKSIFHLDYIKDSLAEKPPTDALPEVIRGLDNFRANMKPVWLIRKVTNQVNGALP